MTNFRMINEGGSIVNFFWLFDIRHWNLIRHSSFDISSFTCPRTQRILRLQRIRGLFRPVGFVQLRPQIFEVRDRLGMLIGQLIVERVDVQIGVERVLGLIHL